ncbi:MucBP domain-containing protein [Listeria valentina]|uniref:MucBP domain-containing protein n=1 Tax=Listeria valentina TaxID=2705293 RepID=UPI001430E237|nr:MucBP domain-containing protein [Listeria valentina]
MKKRAWFQMVLAILLITSVFLQFDKVAAEDQLTSEVDPFFTLTVEYLDKETGEVLQEETQLNLKAGEPYQITAPKFEHYVFLDSTQSLTGNMAQADQKIVLYYQKSQHTLTVQYLDKDTMTKIHPNYSASLDYGEKYSIPEYAIDNYVFQSATAAPNGTMPDADLNVTFYYIKNGVGTLEPNLFTINKDKFVTGTYSGDVSQISLVVNNKFYPFLKVSDSDYNFQYEASKLITDLSQNVWVYAYDKHGKELDRQKVMLDRLPVGTITTNQFVLGQSSYVTGNYTGDTAKIALEVDGEKKQTIAIPEGGSYQYYASNFIHADTEAVYMIAYDETGIELDRKKVNIYQTTGSVIAKPFTVEKDHYITGNYTGDVKKIAILLDDKRGQTITVPEDGTYSYYVGNKLQSGHHSAWMIAYDAAGKELSRTQIEFIHYVTAGSISTDPFILEKDSYITGTYDGDVTKIALEIDGELRQAISVSADSQSYRYYVEKRKELQIGEHQVNVIAYDAAGKELDRKPVELTHYVTSGSITTNPFILGKDSYVTGNYTGDVQKIAIETDGERRQVISVPIDGSYKYYVGRFQVAEAEIYMVAYDAFGKELDRSEVILTN